MMHNQYVAAICLLLALVHGIYADSDLTAAANADLITNMPRLKFTPNFRQFSGYLDGVSKNKQLFYWFVESQFKPSIDPLVLWLNGGPGCSSLEGLLIESGPFKLTSDASIDKNPYSWNNFTNMLFLEAPVGVGFSYDVNGNYAPGDDNTANNNLAALKSFLKKFPQFEGRDFYIAGESYGGVYIPTLTKNVLSDKSFNMKLKGIAIGNGLASYEKNDNSLIYFAYNHGIISNRFWTKMVKVCCADDPEDQCRFTANKSNMCQLLVNKVMTRVSDGLNIYNLYAPCAQPGSLCKSPSHQTVIDNEEMKTEDSMVSELLKVKTNECDSKPGQPNLYNNDFGNLFRNNVYVQAARKKINEVRQANGGMNTIIPCVNDRPITNYFNDKAVRKAIHASSSIGVWNVCSDFIISNYNRQYMDMTRHYHFIMDHEIRVLSYNGDVDMACNYLGNAWFLEDLQLQTKSRYRVWQYRGEDGSPQIGGFTKQYKSKSATLTFATVRGSGHMVPTDQPRSAFYMFLRFVKNKNM